MTLRCTAKVLILLDLRAADLVEAAPSADDWYVNLLWIDRRKCVLLTHAGTLFPVFVADVRKSDLRPIGPYVVSLIDEHLRSEDLAADILGRLDPADVHVAKTASRSILASASGRRSREHVEAGKELYHKEVNYDIAPPESLTNEETNATLAT